MLTFPPSSLLRANAALYEAHTALNIKEFTAHRNQTLHGLRDIALLVQFTLLSFWHLIAGRKSMSLATSEFNFTSRFFFAFTSPKLPLCSTRIRPVEDMNATCYSAPSRPIAVVKLIICKASSLNDAFCKARSRSLLSASHNASHTFRRATGTHYYS